MRIKEYRERSGRIITVVPDLAFSIIITSSGAVCVGLLVVIGRLSVLHSLQRLAPWHTTYACRSRMAVPISDRFTQKCMRSAAEFVLVPFSFCGRGRIVTAQQQGDFDALPAILTAALITASLIVLGLIAPHAEVVAQSSDTAQPVVLQAAHLFDAEVGSLEVGKLADIVAVRGNVLNDIRSTEKPLLVIRHGRVVVGP